MSTSSLESLTRRARTGGRIAGCAASVAFMIGAFAAPATAQFDPPPPTPDPWARVDLSRPLYEPPAAAPAAPDDTSTTVAVGALGAISGVVLTAGVVGAVAITRRRHRPSQLLHG